jgi:hypothetical protein
MKSLKFLPLLTALFLLFASPSCAPSDEADLPCGYYNGNRLYLGPKGGCYYINSAGNKTYVDRSDCKC